tara:strand:- start:62 stop:613 length:552 start_codon:yes stop_codon:yes gene_type:complete
MALIKTRARGLKLDDTFAFTGTVSGAGGGIEVAGSFRLTTSFTGSANPITTNYEEDDVYYSRIGSAVTESSGVFTMPSTGVYLIIVHTAVSYSGELNYHEMILQGSNDGFSSNVQTIASKYTAQADHGATAYFGASNAVLYDVTNTSNNKVRLRISSAQSGATTRGHTDNNQTSLTFIRMGDT